MIGIIPKLSISQILGLVATKIYDGHEDIAMGILQEWLACNGDKPDAFMAWYELGLQFLRKEMLEAAQTAFESTLGEGRCFPEAAFKLAEVISARGEASNNTVNPGSANLAYHKLH